MRYIFPGLYEIYSFRVKRFLFTHRAISTLLAIFLIWSPLEMKYFYDCNYGRRSSRLTADILTVLSDRIVAIGAIQAGTLDITEDFDWVYNADLLKKHKTFEIPDCTFSFDFLFLING